MKRLSAFIFGFGITGVILIIGCIFFFYVTSPNRYNVLVVGSDQRGSERARSDVMFVLSIPKQGDKNPFMLSIPRDTKVEDAEWGLQKMTHFYALGDRPDDGKELGNIDLTKKEVENLLDIEIDATVEVTFQSFAELVDALGGVAIEQRADTGEQFNGVDTSALTGKTISGEEALTVIRDRFTGGRSDFNRQADERQVFQGLFNKIKKPAQAQQLLNYFTDSAQARLHYKKVKVVRFLIGALIARKGSVSIAGMDQESLPGQSDYIYTPDFGKELYYWVADEEAIKNLVDKNFR